LFEALPFDDIRTHSFLKLPLLLRDRVQSL
jgi:hypothetical protein